jgi:cytochrome c
VAWFQVRPEAQCKACHSVEPGKNGIGPSLAGIFGDRAAIVPGFEFSDAMKNSGLTWNQATLDRYLTDPRGVVPGTKMSFGGVKDAAKRQEIINYLKTI